MSCTPRVAERTPGDAVGRGYGRPVTAPRDVVVVLLDSLNRHMIGAYGGTEFDTPNLDRLAARSVRFTNHHTGSLPCMPARHDLLVGALDFPWRPWGSIEIWEDAITTLLRQQAGISTMLASDHPHLFETGGENYHVDFGAWDYLRGHEDDPWRTRPDPSWIGAPALPARRQPGSAATTLSRTWFRDEVDFPGPKTMMAAASWLDARAVREREPHERALLVVDEFDPHEPFDTPEPWTSRYDPDWDGERLIWPPYAAEPGAVGPHRAREHPPAEPVRRQAVDDRPLARAHPRGRRQARRVGHDRVRPLHRPRPLPGRARVLGQARRSPSTRSSVTSRC